MTAFVQDMGVDHRSANVFVAKKFLDGAAIMTSAKCFTKAVCACFYGASLLHRTISSAGKVEDWMIENCLSPPLKLCDSKTKNEKNCKYFYFISPIEYPIKEEVDWVDKI